MKTLLFMATSGPLVGGMEKQVAMQANLLKERDNVEVSVIASPCYKNLFDTGIHFIPLNLKRSRRNPILLWQIKRLIKAEAPDIVHAHGHKAAEICVLVRSRFMGMKWIATAHGLKKKNQALSKMDRAVCVSKGIQNQLGDIPSQVIYNGVPEAESEPLSKDRICQMLNLDASKPLLMTLGRLVKVKRYDVLVSAMEGLDANLVLVGDGVESETLKKLAPSNVVFAGYQDDGRAWLNAADMMVITSEREGFSLAMIEALQAETTVISTPVPGAVDLLPEACLIDATDVPTLQAELRLILDQLVSLRESMSTVFKFAQTELTIQKVVDHTFSVYEDVLDRDSRITKMNN